MIHARPCAVRRAPGPKHRTGTSGSTRAGPHRRCRPGRSRGAPPTRAASVAACGADGEVGGEQAAEEHELRAQPDHDPDGRAAEAGRRRGTAGVLAGVCSTDKAWRHGVFPSRPQARSRQHASVHPLAPPLRVLGAGPPRGARVASERVAISPGARPGAASCGSRQPAGGSGQGDVQGAQRPRPTPRRRRPARPRRRRRTRARWRGPTGRRLSGAPRPPGRGSGRATRSRPRATRARSSHQRRLGGQDTARPGGDRDDVLGGDLRHPGRQAPGPTSSISGRWPDRRTGVGGVSSGAAGQHPAATSTTSAGVR